MRSVAIVGAGIVGVALARELSVRGVDVTVLERDRGVPRGSTAFAPGFVGIFSDAEVLTELARTSSVIYDEVGTGFERCGCVELATSSAGAAELTRRTAAAQAVGLRVHKIDPAAVGASFVDTRQVIAAAFFEDDGAADVKQLHHSLWQHGVDQGVRFLPGHDVLRINRRGQRYILTTGHNELVVDDIVLCAGVWGPSLAAMLELELPLYPVAHPYVYARHDSAMTHGPIIRWPEQHVYARVHGDRLGLGSYDHPPIVVAHERLLNGASIPWIDAFDPVIASAQRLLRPEARFRPEIQINGVFAMTPDNLPFLGPHPTLPGVWIAEAIWVSLAAGSAARLAAAMNGEAETEPQLAVDRFTGIDRDVLRSNALRLYRDVNATGAGVMAGVETSINC